MPDAGVKEAVRFYAKQLKLPTFANVEEAAGRFRAGDSLESFVLALMKREYDARQEKTRQRRLKRRTFPCTKRWKNSISRGCSTSNRNSSSSWPAAPTLTGTRTSC